MSIDPVASGASSLGVLFSSTVRSYGSNTALVEGSRTRSYLELEQRTNRLANALLLMGLKKDDRVALLARNCLEYLEIEIAAAKAGVIVAALNWRLTEPDLEHCINLVEPKLIIMQEDYTPLISRLEIKCQALLAIGEPYETAIAEQSAEFAGEVVDPETGLVILYTSGTTGLPKGALISHRAMVARAAVFVADLHLKPSANFVAWAPLFHMASTDHSLATLLRGGTVFVVDGYQPDVLMDLVESVPIGWFVLMPGMVGEFAQACKQRGVKTHDITVCGAMADLVPREEIAAVTTTLNAPYANSFGATETGLPPATANLIPIGVAPNSLTKRQSSFIELRLVDPDDNEVADGVPGEVALRGPTLFSGYWNAVETNAHDFRNGWFHMGDVMRRNPDGTLDYVDRVKYMIKSGGENIYPAEIEHIVELDKRISEAIVVRKMDAKWGEVPVAFIVAKDKSLTVLDVEEICAVNLAGYKRPKEIVFINESDLPRSTTGKIQRHELEKRL